MNWSGLAQTQNAQPAYQGRDMEAPVQQFSQPQQQQVPAYSADLGDQLDLLSGGALLNSAPPATPPALDARGAISA